jgi:hypothetical protein
MNDAMNQAEVLRDVKRGQHLRFITLPYRTKQVCLAAVLHESSHTSMIHDLYAVPAEHLDYVVDEMRKLKEKDSWYLECLDKAVIEIQKK